MSPYAIIYSGGQLHLPSSRVVKFRYACIIAENIFFLSLRPHWCISATTSRRYNHEAAPGSTQPTGQTPISLPLFDWLSSDENIVVENPNDVVWVCIDIVVQASRDLLLNRVIGHEFDSQSAEQKRAKNKCETRTEKNI